MKSVCFPRFFALGISRLLWRIKSDDNAKHTKRVWLIRFPSHGSNSRAPCRVMRQQGRFMGDMLNLATQSVNPFQVLQREGRFATVD